MSSEFDSSFADSSGSSLQQRRQQQQPTVQQRPRNKSITLHPTGRVDVDWLPAEEVIVQDTGGSSCTETPPRARSPSPAPFFANAGGGGKLRVRRPSIMDRSRSTSPSSSHLLSPSLSTTGGGLLMPGGATSVGASFGGGTANAKRRLSAVQSAPQPKCAICGTLASGLLFRCQECQDAYIVCENCVDGDAVNQHDQSHTLQSYFADKAPIPFASAAQSSPTISQCSSFISAEELTERDQAFMDITKSVPHSLRRSSLPSGPTDTIKETLAYCRSNPLHVELDLSHYQLTDFSGEIDNAISCGSISHVSKFDASHNLLVKVPHGVFALDCITQLHLGNNQITELPEEVCLLSRLEVLDVNCNLLTDLPQHLEVLHDLRTVVVDFNRFAKMPLCVLQLPILTKLYLQGNPSLTQFPEGYLPSMSTQRRSAPLEITLDNHPHLVTQWREAQALRIDGLTVNWNPVFPDRILPNLYLGSIRSTLSPHVYAYCDITTVFTVGRKLEPLILEGMQHYEFIVDDIVGATVDLEGTSKLQRALQNGRGSLVHCHAGMSRSATFVTAFLMKYHKLRLDDAFHAIKAARPCVYPNDGFWKQLIQLDAILFPNADARDFTNTRGKPP